MTTHKKTWRLVAIALAATLACTSATGALGTGEVIDGAEQQFREKVQELTDNYIRAGDPAKIEGIESFNQNDYDTNFVEYADPDSTVILPIPLDEEAGISNVVGTVLCKETNELITNAVVTVKVANDEVVSVNTDENGRFHILGLTGGFYNWSLESDDYFDAEYIGYDVCEGITTMFTFYMSNVDTLERESAQSQKMASDGEFGSLIYEQDPTLDSIEPNEEENHASRSFSSIPTLSSFTVGVGANSNGNGGTATTVSRSSYLVHVVPNEAIGSWVCKNTYSMTDNQIKQYYAAQAIAACTFIEYTVHEDPKHSDYTVCDNSNCQM